MQKKRFVIALLTTVMVFSTAPSAFAADQITVTVDGEKVNFKDQQPVNIDNRVMVPVRDVAEKMGWEVSFETYPGNTLIDGYFQDQDHVIISRIVDVGKDLGRNFIYLTNITIDDNSIVVGNSGYYEDEKPLIATPIIKNGRTLLSVRDIAEGLHADVSWDSNTQTVEIKTKPVEQFAYYDKLLDYVERYEGVSNESEEQEHIKTNTLTIEEEQLKMEKYAEEQNAKRDKFAEEVIHLTNIEREKAGLNPLEMDDSLMKAADVRVKELSESFSHTRPDGSKYDTAAKEAGYAGDYIGENITGFANSPKWAVENWTESDKHRENYLNPEYVYTGVAYLYDKDSEYGSYWVQIFAK